MREPGGLEPALDDEQQAVAVQGSWEPARYEARDRERHQVPQKAAAYSAVASRSFFAGRSRGRHAARILGQRSNCWQVRHER